MSKIRYIWSKTTYLARDETHAVADVHLSSWRLSNAVKYTPQPNLLTPLMGARDGFVKAATVKLYIAAKKAPTVLGLLQEGFRRSAAQDISFSVP